MSIFQRLFLWFFAANVVTLAASILIAFAIFERRADRAPDISPLVESVSLALDQQRPLPLDRRRDNRRWYLVRGHRQFNGERLPGLVDRHLEDLLVDRAELRLPRGLWMVSRQCRHPHQDIHLIVLQSPPEPRPWQRLVLPGLQILLSILAIAGVGWVVARHLATPLARIQTVARRVAAGQLDSRIGGALAERRDEYGRLARDFDRMTAQIESLVNSRDQLLHDVSHELRAPLSRLRFALELARDDSAGAATGDALERADREITRIDALVGQLLTLARLDQPLNPRDLQRLDLRALTEDVVEAEQPQAAQRGIRFDIQGSDASAQGEPESLMRALENVVRNAVRHAPDQSCIEIEIGARQGEAGIRVRDTGPGVPPEDLPRLFEPFFRSRQGAATGGHGLGLAIVARILRAHHGRAEAQLRPGGGLEVSLYWPQTAPAAPGEAA